MLQITNNRVETIYKDLDLIDFQEAWDYQETIFSAILDHKRKENKDNSAKPKPMKNHLIFCEHPHVYTLGRSGKESNLLINEDLLRSKGATFYKINRGGDITYHGPGQIVGYPVFDLELFQIGVKEYINALEECIIKTLMHFKLYTSRLNGATGVWLDTHNPVKARKICAIGVRASRYVTMHGFALNVNTDLSFYNYINPCGFVDKGVTSMQKELNTLIKPEDVKSALKDAFKSIFNINYLPE